MLVEEKMSFIVDDAKPASFDRIVNVKQWRFLKIKRMFDILCVILSLVVVLPIIIAVAVLIKIVSPGPVFLKQKRVGLNGKIFELYKMRTMKVDAEASSGPVWAKKNDPRLIKFGEIIRKLHIDEFPQLLNVIKGEMSMIGPRPERPMFVEKLSAEIMDYKKRLNVMPGITGLAQVRHKYDETIKDVRKKVKYDLHYIRKMCFAVDMQILMWTASVMLTGEVIK